jgi:hypothetical protein
MHVPVQCFQNALAYFAMDKSYEHKMFVKFTSVLEQKKHYTLSDKQTITII